MNEKGVQMATTTVKPTKQVTFKEGEAYCPFCKSEDAVDWDEDSPALDSGVDIIAHCRRCNKYFSMVQIAITYNVYINKKLSG